MIISKRCFPDVTLFGTVLAQKIPSLSGGIQIKWFPFSVGWRDYFAVRSFTHFVQLIIFQIAECNQRRTVLVIQ